MPLKLVPPRSGKTPNYSIRGTYLGQYVDRTAGTPDRKTAQKELNAIKADIECGRFTGRKALTFAGAALAYLRNGKEAEFIGKLTDHFALTPLERIDQAAIDEAAEALYPRASAATRNRQVYTPMSAILKHNGIEFSIKRPKGAQGEQRTEWMTPEQAERLLDAAESVDGEFRTFLALLLYTGLRLSEALAIKCAQVDLAQAMIFVPKTKNGEARAVHINPALMAELASHPKGLERGREPLHRFNKNGRLYTIMRRSKEAAGLPDVSFHTFRHTWATWMRRYAKLDTKGLVATGAWKDEKSASRYQHVIVTEEAQRVDMLPVMKRKIGGKSVE